MSIDGTTTGEYITQEAIAGSNVILTIDAKVQQVAEQSLKNNIEIEKLTLEEAFDKIDNLMDEMSEEDIALDKSFELYKEGMELLKHCSEKIDLVEKQVQMINEKGEIDEF